jgi:hypothetical protein
VSEQEDDRGDGERAEGQADGARHERDDVHTARLVGGMMS